MVKYLLIAVALAVTALTADTVSVVVSEENTSSYDRRDWKSWKDLDKNGLSTRQEVLKAESLIPVTAVKKSYKWKVVNGLWFDHYRGTYVTAPGSMDVEHIVPLKEAHESGAWSWTTAQRIAYFNDITEDHLMMVNLSDNRSKQNKSPDEWMPPNAAFHCHYLAMWVRVKARYKLSYDQKEFDYVNNKRSVCRDLPKLRVQ